MQATARARARDESVQREVPRHHHELSLDDGGWRGPPHVQFENRTLVLQLNFVFFFLNVETAADACRGKKQANMTRSAVGRAAV